MIKVELYSAPGSDEPVGFMVSGHTGVSGQSVVCAAVSSACYMAANTITDVLGVKADISEKDGYMRVIVDGDGIQKSWAVLSGLRLHLEQLAGSYPKQIKIRYSEVHQ